MQTDNFSSSVAGKLDILIRLVAIGISDGKSRRDQYSLLSKAGFQPLQIGEILGLPSATVRGELSKIRKGLKGTRKKP